MNEILSGKKKIFSLKKGDKSKINWTFKLYGNYTRPISLFSNCYQKDLDSLYKKQGSKFIGFGIGYNFNDQNSNLFIARSE